MFNRRRVKFSYCAFRDILTPDEKRAVMKNEVTRIRTSTIYTAIFDTEDHAVQIARFLMNKDVPYVQRG